MPRTYALALRVAVQDQDKAFEDTTRLRRPSAPSLMPDPRPFRPAPNRVICARNAVNLS